MTRPEHKRPGKRKRVSAVLLAWRAERLLGLLIAGQRLHPEGQPRELFADNPQLVLRAGFVRWPCCARAGARSSRCSAVRRRRGRLRRGRSNPAEWVLIPPTCSGARGGACQSVQCYNCGVHVERRDIGCACRGAASPDSQGYQQPRDRCRNCRPCARALPTSAWETGRSALG